MVDTEEGPVDVETEVNSRMPRGSDPGLDQVPKDRPIVLCESLARRQIRLIRDRCTDSGGP